MKILRIVSMVKSAIWFVCVCLGDFVAYVKNRKNA